MMLPFSRPAGRHETWFAQHYADLLAWALRLTGGDRDAAEDLVHDLFVHVVSGQPDLDAIENPKGYLRTSLRNLHFSNARREARHQESIVAYADFDVLDYTSLRASLRQVIRDLHAAHIREQFQHQLRAVWRYAQLRKHSSKAGSVLLLRFFHGYYPEEIALILRASRDAVDHLLREARREVRASLAEPGACGDQACTIGTGWPAEGLLHPPDLAMALHQAALRSDPNGICLTDADVTARYPASGDGPSVPVNVVAHIASCGHCLSRVTRRLDLPPLADRHPLDAIGYDRDQRPPRDGTGGGAGSGTRSRLRRHLEAGRRRLADLLAHEPKELRIAVNGVILGSQHVTSPVNRLTLRSTAPADFVEVFSDQDVRLLFMNLEAPPRGPVEAHHSIAFNGGRRLDARVTFAGALPAIHVLYVDPSLIDAPSQTPSPAPRPAPLLTRVVKPRFGWPLWRLSRRGAFTALVAATTAAVVLLNQVSQPVLSAAELLEKSRVAGTRWRSDATHTVHRTVDVEARSRETGAIVRRRVDVWQSGARGLTVRRAFDEQNRLLAGEWIDTADTRTVHRAGDQVSGEPAIQGIEAWRIEPSPADFTRLIGRADLAAVTRNGGRVVLAFEPRVSAAGQGVLGASLTLGDDWRALEQRATVRTSTGLMEFTWIERQRVSVPTETVPRDAFEVDTRLAAGAAASPAIAPATARVELAALAALRRIDADLGEEVRVRRANGRLDITGVVGSPRRQAQIRSVLAGVARDHAVRLRIDTVEEVHARARGRALPRPVASPEDTRAEERLRGGAPLEIAPPRIPAHESIRQYLLSTGVAARDANDDVARLANDLVQQASRMRVHAWALRGLLDRISAADVDAFDTMDRQRWRALVFEHGREFVREAAAFRALAAPVFPEPERERSSAARAVDDQPLSDERLRHASASFVRAAAALDEVIESAFTLPAAGRAAAAPFDPRHFWIDFTQTVALAQSLDSAGSISHPRSHPQP
jgi:RNA polymerase sigma factor (sigma-70 family)